MLEKINIDKLRDIYIISNTAPFLYKEFSKDDSLINFYINNSTSEILKSFKEISETNIDSVDEIVYAYALYIALMHKADTYEIIKDKFNIQFEWFPELKSIFLSKYKPTQVYNFDIKRENMVTIEEIRDGKEANNQIINL